MPVFVMAGLDGPKGPDIRKTTRPAHLEWIKSLGARVKLAGPLFKEDGETPMGSIIYIEAASLEEATRIYGEDPYRAAGLFERIEIRGFMVVAGGFAA